MSHPPFPRPSFRPNWQLTGLSLPATGQLRARGRTTSGYQNGSSGLIEQVAAYSFTNAPEIAIEQPATTNIPNAGSIDFGSRPVGNASTAKVFTIRNTGTGDLTITAPSVSGGNAGDFAVNNAGTLFIIPAAGQTTFTVGFTPGAGGARTATLSIPSDDADENPFTIALTGTGLVMTNDTDGDGLNDVAEFNYSALGFDWQTAQPALVQSLFTNANSAGLFTTAQVQALHLGTPLISRNVATGKFKLTLGLTKTTTLSPTNWLAFPFIGAGTSVNGLGGLEFEFTAPDNAAFFRIETD